MGASKITSIVLVSLILIAVLVAVVNVGMSLFYDSPDYNKYCPTIPSTQEECESQGYTWHLGITNCEESKGCINSGGYCDTFKCNIEYDKAIENYNQIKFYIFAGLGLILMLLGLFIPEIITKVVGLSTGGILTIQGIVMNFQNKWAVFISLIIILIIFGVLGVRVVRKMK